MDIRKLILFFDFFVFFFMLLCHNHLATQSETASTKHIEQQINGTVNVCKDTLGILWKNDNKPLHETITSFNVCVPKKVAFHEFVDVNDDNELKGGFSIAIFCLVLQELSFKIQPIFMPIDGNYTQIVQKLQGNDCDAVAGDITITSNRTEYADFTISYMSSKIYILVPAVRKWEQTMLTLIRPFTMRLWFAIIMACIIIGIAIDFLEYREENPSFYHVPFSQKLFMIIWFPVSRIYFQEGEIRNRCSKVVLVTWLTMIFIVMQIFTACLSSWLTVNQLQPKVPKEYKLVGYQNGSFVADFVHDQYAQSSGFKDKEIALSSVDDYKSALDNGMVDAIFDERPYIDLFLAKYGDTYMKVGPIADESGLGFAFSRGSPLQQNFSNAIVKVTESSDMAKMKYKYLKIKTLVTTQPPDLSVPQSLDIQSFFFLFLFMALTTAMAIIISEISHRRTGRRYNEPREMLAVPERSTQNAENAQ